MFGKREEMLAAITWALEADDPDTVLRIIAAVGHPMGSLGVHLPFVDPGREALLHPGATRDRNYAIAAAYIAWIAGFGTEGQSQGIRDALDHALSVAQETDDLVASGVVKMRLSRAITDPRRSLEMHEEAIEDLRIGGYPHFEGVLFNRAIHFMFDGDFGEAARVADESRIWWEKTLGVPFAGYFTVAAEVSEYEGDWKSALELHERAATLGEADIQYIHSAGDWERAGLAAVRLGLSDRVASAAERRRRLSVITGAMPSVALEIEAALDAQDFNAVLHLAREWFSMRAPNARGDPYLITSDTEETIYGTALVRPRVFTILRPVAAALLATNHPEEACRIVTSLPSLIEESSFEYWDQFRETELWEPLIDACRVHGAADAKSLTLPQVFDFVREVVNSRATVA
jgi:hypothetical protein